MDIKKLKDQVEYILKTDEQSRNSDIRLTIQIWKEFYAQKVAYIEREEYVRLRDIFDLPREDNIKRIRAKFQNDLDMYIPTTWKVAQKRGWLRDKWREALGYPVKDIRQGELINLPPNREWRGE